MRAKPIDYRFTRLEIGILRLLTNGEQPLSDIGRSLSIRPSLTSHLLGKLSEKALVTLNRRGIGKRAAFSNSRHAQLLRDVLLIHAHVDWENALHGLAVEILFWVLDQSASSAASFSRATLWRHTKNLKARGILDEDGRRYTISLRFERLKEFLEEYQRFIMADFVHSLADGEVIIWQQDMECLFEGPHKIEPLGEGLEETATSSFGKFGLPLLTQSRVYFYSREKRELKVEDVILHTLLLEGSEVRNTLYGLLLMKKEWKRMDTRLLRQESGKYSLTIQIDDMLDFLETNGTRRNNPRLPTWNEFIGKAVEYGVAL